MATVKYKTPRDLEDILAEAHQAGLQSPDFAYVVLPGNTLLARYCHKKVVSSLHAVWYGYRHTPGKWVWWCPGAEAFRDVLAKHGIRADVVQRG